LNSALIIPEIKRHWDIKGMFESCYSGRKLVKQGHRYRTHCPIHLEKTPSFYLDTYKDRFNCYGCGIYGDPIDLYALAHGLSNREAIAQLAHDLGLSVDISPEARNTAKVARLKRERIKAVNTDFEMVVNKARLDCWNIEGWLHMFLKHIRTEQDLKRPGPTFALQHLHYVEHIGDLFLSDSPLDQLSAVKLLRRWEACHMTTSTR